MTISTKQTIGTVLTTIGVALGSGGGISIPAGAPAWVGIAIATVGAICYAIGNQFKHSSAADTTSQVATGAAIDRGEAVKPISAAVLPTPVLPPAITLTVPVSPANSVPSVTTQKP